MNATIKYISLLIFITIIGCQDKSEDSQDPIICFSDNPIPTNESRNFLMGFSTWAYALTTNAVLDTYSFIDTRADIYSEHIDSNIPWNAWINDSPLPLEFTQEIDGRVSRRLDNVSLTLSVSPLNIDRNDLVADIDGVVPPYTNLNDQDIEDAYFKHVKYLVERLNPEYLIIAIEVNGLRLNAPEKWEGYKLLIANVKSRVLNEFPNLRISESLMLHNLFEPETENPDKYLAEMFEYANAMEFVSISYYPFLKGQKSQAEFQEAFDFLHSNITRPIAFSETSHLAQDLIVDGYNLYIPSTECEQKAYLQTLFENAQIQDYEYIIWWCHRDYTELWLEFPEESRDLGMLWLYTGLLTDEGAIKKAFPLWNSVFDY